MCISPVKIRNPNYHNSTPLIRSTTDTYSKFIEVPCGVCVECMFKRQNDLVCRVRNMMIDHYLFFFTLTYNQETLPIITTSLGDSISFADISDIQKMFKRIRKYNFIEREFKYIVVSERGTRRGRPHFHGLLFVPKYPSDDSLTPAVLETQYRKLLLSEWKRNYGSNRSPIWKNLCTYKSKIACGKLFQNYDFHYVVSHSTANGADDVAFYVTKYILKPSTLEKKLQQKLKLQLDEEEYNKIWKIVKSQALYSKNIGALTTLQKAKIESCIEMSKYDSNGFQYITNTGKKQSLPRYYRKYVKPDQAIINYKYRINNVRNFDSKLSSLHKGEEILQKVSNRDISELTNF